MGFKTCLSSLVCLILAITPAVAGNHEVGTIDSSMEVLQTFTNLKIQAIPPALLQDAQGIAIIPNVVKAGFIVGGRFGRGIVVVRQKDGSWAPPIFLTLGGGGIGWQVGVQSTDLVLVFKTRNGLERILQGKSKLTLGADVAVSAGPIGRNAEAATDGQLKAEILSYSRSRGLFAGLSVEGAGLTVDTDANEGFYRLLGGKAGDVVNLKGNQVPPQAEALQSLLSRLTQPAKVIPTVITDMVPQQAGPTGTPIIITPPTPNIPR